MPIDVNNPGQSTLNEVEQLGKFVREMIAVDGSSTNNNNGALFDSAAVTNATLQHINTAPVPAALDRVLGKVDEREFMLVLFDGVQRHCREYGRPPSGDLLDSAIGQAAALYDSASSGHHDQLSLVPAAPQIAILSALSTPVPFGGVLYGSGGAGSSSNELRLIIVSHSASNKLGGYDEGELFDGVSGGKTYFTGDRDISLFAPNDNANYKFAFTSSSGGAQLPLLRGRCKIWVNGQVAALEARQNASGKAVANAPKGLITPWAASAWAARPTTSAA